MTLPLGQYCKVDPLSSTNLVWVSTDTRYGGFLIELLPTNAPKTVANFLSYVRDGAYESTIIHRSTSLTNDGLAVLQAGGFTADPTLSAIPTFAPITNEYSLPNVAGTIAMAKLGGNPNSATSQWFVNVSDNSLTLGSNNNGGFTVFAKVRSNGMSNVINPIASLQTYNLNSYNAAFTQTPLMGVASNQTSLNLSNLVTFTRIAPIPYFAFSSDSDAFPADIVTTPSSTNLIVTFRHYPTNNPIAGVNVTFSVTDTNGHNPSGLYNSFSGSTNDTGIIIYPTTLGNQTITFPPIPQQALSNDITTITTNHVGGVSNFTTNTRTSFTIPTFPSSSANVPVILKIVSGPICVTANTNQKTGILSGTQFNLTGTGTISLVATTYSSTNPVNLGYVLSDGTPLVNYYYVPAPPVTNSFVVKEFAQSITAFPSLLKQPTYGDLPFQILLPTSTSGLPVTASVLSGSASITSSNGVATITVTGAGSVTLAANQAGNERYASAPQVTTSFTVAKSPQSISFPQSTTNLSVGQTVSLTATSSSSLPVSYSLVGGTATLTGNSLKISGPGTVAVVASQVGNSNYLAATPITNNYTTRSNQTISAFGTITNRPYSTNSQTIAVPSSTSKLPVTLSVKSGPATVSTSNSIILNGAGTLTLQADQAGNSNYFPATPVTTSFVVSKAAQTISPFTGIPTKLSNGMSFRLTNPSASSDLTNSTPIVSGVGRLSNGIVTLTNAGILTITATNAGNSNYLATSLTTNIPVSKGAQIINFNFPPTLTIGTTNTLSATASSGLPITYTLNPSVTNVLLTSNSIIVRSFSTNSFKVIASQLGNTGWTNATPLTNSFSISR